MDTWSFRRPAPQLLELAAAADARIRKVERECGIAMLR